MILPIKGEEASGKSTSFQTREWKFYVSRIEEKEGDCGKTAKYRNWGRFQTLIVPLKGRGSKRTDFAIKKMNLLRKVS